MSEVKGKMPTSPASASKGFSSTPLKYSSRAKDIHRAMAVDEYLSSDEDTFSLLSPIYHDSFDSDEELQPDTSLRQTEESPRRTLSPVRCELPKSRAEEQATADERPAVSPALSAWEIWLVNKTKDDRMKMEMKAEEESLLKERQEQEKREQEQKKKVVEERIKAWLTMKADQKRQETRLQQSREEEEIQRQQVKQMHTEQRAQHKYKEWLHKKNQEKQHKEKKEREEAAKKEDQERERRKKAEEKFREWLENTDEKCKTGPKSPCYPRSPYDKGYSSPSFCNPIPWKPIHVPLPEGTPKKKNASQQKPQIQSRHRQCPSGTAYRLRDNVRR